MSKARELNDAARRLHRYQPCWRWRESDQLQQQHLRGIAAELVLRHERGQRHMTTAAYCEILKPAGELAALRRREHDGRWKCHDLEAQVDTLRREVVAKEHRDKELKILGQKK